MEICNVELVGTLMQINQFKSEKNILDVILEIKSEVRKLRLKERYMETYTGIVNIEED